MATSQEKPTLTDFLVMALSPALVMGLIGSLVFFLLEVFYQGAYPGRMQWTLFFYVFGAVLIARIGMMTGIAHRAGLYGPVLGLLVWIGLQTFIEYPADSPVVHFRWAISLGLVYLVWWCAQKLTWDCTYIDDSVDASGQGVLESAGLDEPGAAAAEADEGQTSEEKKKKPAVLVGWWERYCRYQEEHRRRPHTPGVWVVYFSLAALPLFGLGQVLLPPEEGRRRYAFWLLVLYVGSGLGLLLTTSFLGLRRYLRQRQLQMPRAVTGVWLTVGGVLIAALLLTAAFVPRPQAEYAPLGTVSRLGSPPLKASRVAPRSDEPGEGGENSARGKPKSGDRESPQSGDRDGNSGGDAKGQSSDKKDGQGDKKDGQGNSGSSSGNSGQGQNKSNSGSDNSDQREAEKQGRGGPGEKGESQSSSGSSRGNPTSGLSSALDSISTVLKWVVFGVLAVVVGFLVLRSVLRFVANFTNWAASLLQWFRAWWDGLFGGWGKEKAGAAEESEDVPAGPPPFAAFPNPFLDGSAKRRPLADLVRYSFAALEAWAHERGLGRQPEETPLEFAERLGAEAPALEEDVRRLAGLYARAAYAGGGLPAAALGQLQQFWRHLDAPVGRPVPA